MNKKSLSLIFFLIMLIVIIQPAYSIGLAHGPLKHYFEPNKEFEVAFQVLHAKAGTEAGVHLSGNLVEYATMSEIDAQGRFTVTIKLPEKIEPPGMHDITIVASENPTAASASMIGTLTVVRVPIRIVVPYSGKYLDFSDLDASDANIGEDVYFLFRATNWGTEDILSAVGGIDIFDPQGNKVTSVNTDDYAIAIEEEIHMNSTWNTEGMNRGIYSAQAEVTYDGASKSIESSEFRVGELLVSLINYTETIELDGVKPFTMRVKNEWSGTIANVYAEVEIDNKVFKTAPENMDGFVTKELIAYVNTAQFSAGEYDGTVTIRFGEDEKTTVEDIKVTFVEESAAKPGVVVEFSTTHVIIIALIIIIFILILLFLRKGQQPRRKRRR